MTSLYKNPSRTLVILLAFYGILFLVHLGSWGVIETSEARYAEISREMFESGDWIHPRLLGIQHYHKPPVTYWLTSIGYELFGVNSFGARFFLTVSLLVQFIMVFRIGSLLFQDLKQGLLTVVLYSSLSIVLVASRGLTTDSFLNTFILATIACWLQWRTNSKPIWLYLTALSLGLAFLTKGPVALIIPVMVFIGLNKVFFAERNKMSLHHATTSIAFIVTAFSWFLVLIMEDKAFFDYFIFRHTVERLTEAKVFVRTQPFWYYLAFAPLLALPWIIPFFKALGIKSKSPSSSLIKRIGWSWLILPFLFFSLSSSKLVLYVLPLYTGFALIGAYWIMQWPDKLGNIAVRSLTIYIITIILAYFLLPFFDPSITIPLIGRCVLVTIVLVLIYVIQKYQKENLEKIILYSVILNTMMVSASVMFLSNNELKINSMAPVTSWIKENKLDDRQIIIYDKLLPSISFHLQKEIICIHDGNRNLDREVQFEKSDAWKNNLYFLSQPDDQNRINKLLELPSVLIYKGKIKPESDWLTQKFSKQKQLDKWFILYN